MDTTKYNHKPLILLLNISASILLDKIYILFTFAKYQPPYFWTRYISFLLLQNISLHTSGQDIYPFYFCKISASILLDKIYILFTFAKYQPPYFWTRYISFLLSKISASILLDKIYILFTFQNIGLHTSGQDMTYSSEVHDKGDPFSKLLE